MQVFDCDNPQAFLNEQAEQVRADGLDAVGVLRFSYAPNFVADAVPQVITIAFALAKKAEKVVIGIGFLKGAEEVFIDCTDFSSVENKTRAINAAWFRSDQPINLATVSIAKPWGQEIWYTGMEERGESAAVDGEQRVPLSQLLYVLGEQLIARPAADIILLKILDPLPEPVLGDLYFEMHREKREVYVVTNVDDTAWPNGEGGIRYGFDQNKRQNFADDEAFKNAYLDAVNNYRAIREPIDQRIDEVRTQEGYEKNQPVDADTMRRWLAALPPELIEQEQQARATMEAFLHIRPLKVGDVVEVPRFFPHSLMHGVRTIEFQTPVYERLILSFAQKVLTQNHWDTAEAMAEVRVDEGAQELPAPVVDESGVTTQTIVSFDDFFVERVVLPPGTSYRVDTQGAYAIGMGVLGELEVGETCLVAERATVLPYGGQYFMRNLGKDPAVALLAYPHN